MKHASLLALLLLFAGCGVLREISGESPTLAPEQVAWLERCVEDDFAGIGAASARRVSPGVVVIRADGEVISSRPIMQAALRGLRRAGATEVEGGAQLLVKGELNVNATQEERKSTHRYVLELKLIDVESRAVVYAQSYVVNNRHEQQRWK